MHVACIKILLDVISYAMHVYVHFVNLLQILVIVRQNFCIRLIRTNCSRFLELKAYFFISVIAK